MSEQNDLYSIDDIIAFALEKEQEAHDFYVYWAEKINHKEITEVFLEFAQQELKHKEKIKKISLGESFKAPHQKVPDLKIADYLVEVKPTEDTNYQDALIIAMKREKESYNLYQDLSKLSVSENTRNLFLTLAQEEANHKLKIETLYDQYILKED